MTANHDLDQDSAGAHEASTDREERTREELDPFLSPKNGGTELYLIRHGDALPDADEVQPGDYNAQNLSELGRRQAQALARRLRETHFDALYSSPLDRARQTAAPLAAALGLDVEVVSDLREIVFGRIGPALPDGATPAEVAHHLREHLRLVAIHAATSGYWTSIPDSEPSEVFRARVTGAHDTLAARHPGQRIACFGHAGSINVYLAAVLGLDRDFFVPVANTAISIVRVKGTRRALLAINDACHLREDGLLKDGR